MWSASSLLLDAPPLVRWQSPGLLPAAAAAAAALLLAVGWLYPRQVKGLRRRWRWALAGLRMTALAAVLVSFGRPVVLRARTAAEGGPILLLIDRSRSMSVVDTGRRRADLVALADGFGMLPAGARPAGPQEVGRAVDQLRQAVYPQTVRAQAELDYARVSGRGVAAAEARLAQAGREFAGLAKQAADHLPAEPTSPEAGALRDRLAALRKLTEPGPRPAWNSGDVRKRLQEAAAAAANYRTAADQELYAADGEVQRVCDLLDGRSRIELVLDAVTTPRAGLLSRLGEKVPVVGYAFAGDLSPLGTLHPPPAEEGGAEGPGLDVETGGRTTDLSGAVAAALARHRDQGVRAVVVFSDGAQVGKEGAAAATAAGDFGAVSRAVPVYAVEAAPDTPANQMHDVSFDRVTILPARPSVFAGETVVVRAVLRSGGLAADPGGVRLTLDTGPPQPPDAPGDGRPARREDGRWAVQFTLRPTEPGVHLLALEIPPVAGEATAENNRVRRWIKVLPEKIRVVAFAGAGTWDFQFLRAALARGPSWDFITLDARVLDPAVPKLPLTPDQILDQDVLILADVPAGALDAGQWDAVNRLVGRRGGSVIISAGPGEAYNGYAASPAAAGLLPFRPGVRPAWRVWPGERPSFRPQPGPGLPADVLRLGEAAPPGRWQELPALYRVVPLAPADLKTGVKQLLVEPDLRAAVLTELPVGLGRTFFLGTDETWRWRGRDAARDQEQFWRELVRYAAEDPYAVHEGALGLDVRAAAVRPNEPVPVRARIFDPAVEGRAESLRLEVVQDDKTVRTAPLAETVSGGGRFRAVIPGLAEGEYRVRLTGPAEDGGEQSVSVPLHVVGDYEEELHNIAPDPERLTRLAASTGGAVLRLDEMGLLADRLAAARAAPPGVSELPLWDSPYLFAFVVACLGAEWGLRKRFGLI